MNILRENIGQYFYNLGLTNVFWIEHRNQYLKKIDKIDCQNEKLPVIKKHQ
jgi:hypothetical protein